MRFGSTFCVVDQVLRAVDDVVEVLAAHVAVDRGAPVAAVAGAAAVVHVEHHVAARRQQVVEHVLAVVASTSTCARSAGSRRRGRRPPPGARVAASRRPSPACRGARDLLAVARRERDDLRIEPAGTRPLRGGHVVTRSPARRPYAATVHLGRRVAGRVINPMRRAVGRHLARVAPVIVVSRVRGPPSTRHGVEVTLAGITSVVVR